MSSKPGDEASAFPQLARKRKLHVFGLVDGVSIIPRSQIPRVGVLSITVQEIDQITQHEVLAPRKDGPTEGYFRRAVRSADNEASAISLSWCSEAAGLYWPIATALYPMTTPRRHERVISTKAGANIRFSPNADISGPTFPPKAGFKPPQSCPIALRKVTPPTNETPCQTAARPSPRPSS
jgi:hypothetical protein